jgi:hypothetical protein
MRETVLPGARAPPIKLFRLYDIVYKPMRSRTETNRSLVISLN